MNQPSVFPFGIRIDEPVTTITDLVISAICFYAFFALKKWRISHEIYFFLRGYFLCIALATFLGGILGHGFLYAFSPKWKFPGWAFSMIGVNLIERTMISFSKAFIRPLFVKLFLWVNIAELIVFAILAFVTIDFKYVEIHTAYGLVVFVFGFSLYHFFRKNHPETVIYFIGAVVMVIFAFFFFVTKIGISIWFNYMDISHVFLAAASWMFYLGGRKMLELIL